MVGHRNRLLRACSPYAEQVRRIHERSRHVHMSLDIEKRRGKANADTLGMCNLCGCCKLLYLLSNAHGVLLTVRSSTVSTQQCPEDIELAASTHVDPL